MDDGAQSVDAARFARAPAEVEGPDQEYLYHDDRAWKIDDPPMSAPPHSRHRVEDPPLYPRGATMTLAALTLLENAARQINSPGWRREYEPMLRRRIRSIQVTYSSGLTTDEILKYQQKWDNAINIFKLSRLPGPTRGRPSRWTSTKPLPRNCRSSLRRFARSANRGKKWTHLYGQKRAASSDGADSETVRVMSIDIGGGTTDTAIVEYRDRSRQSAVDVEAKLLFRDSGNLAGDVLVKRIIDGGVADPAREHRRGRRKAGLLAVLGGQRL